MGYENLLILSDNIDVIVKEKNLFTKDGLCAGNKIAINQNLNTTKEKYCILAEELGHYFRTVGNILDQSDINNKKQELIARRWAHEHTVTLIGLIEGFEYGCRNKYEMAEFLGVTDKYFQECIDDYRKKYGISHSIEQYYIRFEPNLGIYKNLNYKRCSNE